GVDVIGYTMTGARSGEGTVPASGSIGILAQGVTTVNYFATDLAGNVEAMRSVVVRIDSTPPVTAVTLSTPANAAGWHDHDVTVNFAAGDNNSGAGADFIRYTLSG